MPEVQAVFFELLRAGLWDKTPQLEGVLSQTQWEEVYALSLEQSVIGMVYAGITKLPASQQPLMSLQAKLAAHIERIERINSHIAAVQQELIVLLESRGLSPMVLKGMAMNRYYSQPEWRIQGDIDFFFPRSEEVQQAIHCLAEKRIEVIKESDGSWCFFYAGVAVEIHPHAFDLHVGRKEQAIWQALTLHTDEDGLRRLPAEAELFMLNLHILKHCCGTGIGLKQLCDMAAAAKYLSDEVDGESLKNLYHKAYIVRWSHLLYATLVQYLGLPKDTLPGYYAPTKRTRSLIRLILRDGRTRYAREQRLTRRKNVSHENKAVTATTVLRHLPFSLFWAPYHVLIYIYTLVKGNI